MQLSESEWIVMRYLWQHHPSTAREVLEAVGPETSWAYTTVKTMLSRLVDKGALKVRMRGNTSLYEPAVSQVKAQRSAVRNLIDRAFDGAFGPLVHFLVSEEELSAETLDELQQLLEQQDKKERKERRK